MFEIYDRGKAVICKFDDKTLFHLGPNDSDLEIKQPVIVEIYISFHSGILLRLGHYIELIVEVEGYQIRPVDRINYWDELKCVSLAKRSLFITSYLSSITIVQSIRYIIIRTSNK